MNKITVLIVLLLVLGYIVFRLTNVFIDNIEELEQELETKTLQFEALKELHNQETQNSIDIQKIMRKEIEEKETEVNNLTAQTEEWQYKYDMMHNIKMQPMLYKIPKPDFEMTMDDLHWLMQIVEAEAGIESYEGKLAVANVIINRVRSENFPDSISRVIFQKTNGVYQFSPVANGSIYTKVPSTDTLEAIQACFEGANNVEDSLYFFNRKRSTKANIEWFDRSTKLIAEIDRMEYRR